MATNNALVLGACMVAVGAILAMVALWTVGWHKYESSVIKVRFGLYDFCVETAGNEVCDEIEEPVAKVKATRGLGISGMIFLLLATLFHIIFMYKRYKDSSYTCPLFLKVSIFQCIISAIQIYIATIVYSTHYDHEYDQATLYYSYYLFSFSPALGLAGAIVAFTGRPKTVQPSNNPIGVVITTTQHHYPPMQQVSVITQPYPVAPPSYPGPSMNQAYPPPPPYGQPPAHGYNYNNAAYPPPANQNPAYPPPPPTTYQPPKN